MDYTKNYENWIAGLTKDQFDILIKAFLKDFWNLETISITDGKGDGGIDIKIFEGNRNKKIPIQLTIDKNLYNKLLKDLEKVTKLIDNHGYSDTFYFYYSQGASESKVVELIDIAREKYSIELRIFDKKLIATYLNKPNFFNSRETLRNFFGEFVDEESSYFDENQKLYFDYLSHADDSKELKERFIISYILNELYRSENSSKNENDLINSIQTEFGSQASKNYCVRLLNNLITKRKIEKIDDLYKLTLDEVSKIKDIVRNSELVEQEFASKLQELINKSGSNIELRFLIEKLKNIFFSQKKIDLNEISYDVDSPEFNAEIKDFYDYINNYFYDSSKCKPFIKDIFNICQQNNFLAKLSAGKLFKELMDNPEFSAYARRTNKEVFLDTPILIYLLLVMKEPDFDYDNYRFKIAKELFDLIISSDDSAVYSTTQFYVRELSDYFLSAIKLIPLQEIGVFESLGGSNNEILNFYSAVKEANLFEGSFKSYIESFGIQISKTERDDDNEYLNQVFYRLFKDNYIQIDEVPFYNKEFKTRRDYERVERALAEIYSTKAVNRRPRSLMFDSLLFTHINELENLTDPTILTWDKTFNEFRRDFLPNNPNFKYWHLFTPGKFLDHVSLLKFKINGEAISNEILAMIEAEFEVIEGVRKIADTLASIIDLRSSRGIALSRGLADIRDINIYQINKENSDDHIIKDNQAVDNIVSELVDYYSNTKGEFGFNDFINSLQIDEVVDELLNILKEENNHYMKYSQTTRTYKDKYDKLIKKYRD